MAQNVVAAAWWLLAGNAIVLGCAMVLEFAPRTLKTVLQRPVQGIWGRRRSAALPYAAYNGDNGEQKCAASAAEPTL